MCAQVADKVRARDGLTMTEEQPLQLEGVKSGLPIEWDAATSDPLSKLEQIIETITALRPNSFETTTYHIGFAYAREQAADIVRALAERVDQS